MSTRDLVFDILAIDRASQVFSKVGAEAEGMAGKIDKTNGLLTVGMATAGAAVVAFGAKSVQMAADFQTSITRLATTAGESQNNLKMVGDGILDMAGKVGFSAQDLAQAMYVVESAGYHGANALNILKNASQGAAIEGTNVRDMVDAVTSLMVDYHLQADKSAMVTNVLTAAVGHGKTTLQEMATALPNVAAAAATTHVTMAETASAIATMTMHGTDAAKAGTYLRQVLGQLEGGTTKAHEVMKGLGIDFNQLSLTLSSGSGHGLYDAIKMIDDGIQKHLTPSGLVAVETFKKSKDATSDYQKMLANLPPALIAPMGALAEMVGGVKSLQGFLQLGGENLAVFKANTDAVNASVRQGGDAVTGWAEVQGTFNQQMHEAEHAIGAMAIRFGQDLLPAATEVAHVVGDFFGILTANKGTVEDLAGGVLIAAGAFIALKGAQKAWVEIQAAMVVMEDVTAFMQLATEVSSAADMFTLLKMAFAETPFGLMATVVGGAAAAILGFVGHLDDAKRHQAEYKKSVQDLADTYDQVTHAATDATNAMIKSDLAKSGAFKEGKKLGLSEDTIVAASTGDAAALKTVQDELDLVNDKWAAFNNQAREAAGGLGISQDRINQMNPALTAQAAAVASLSDSLGIEKQKQSDANTELVNTQTATNMAKAGVTNFVEKLKGIPAAINQDVVPNLRDALPAGMKIATDDMHTVITGQMDQTVGGDLRQVFSHAGQVAQAGGQQVAGFFATGFSGGLSGFQSIVNGGAAKMIEGALAAAKTAADSHSPSRKMHKQGQDFAQGFAHGILEDQKSVLEASQQTVDAALQQVQKQVTDAQEWGKSLLGNVFTANLDKQMAATQQFLTIGGQKVQVTTPGGKKAMKDLTDAELVDQMIGFQRGQWDTAFQMDNDAQRLRALGASDALLDQLKGSGEQGIREMHALAYASADKVQTLSYYLWQTQNSANDAGAFATTGQSFGTLSSRMDEDKRQQENIKAALRAVELRISGGGSLRVT